MNEPLPIPATCPACGGRLVAGSNGALCPACMLQAAIADDSVAEEASPQDSRGEQPGARIGHYKLLEKIGEGGFGIVWMAEQEEPVRRRVALKIIKPGMDSREVVARFEAERQALAMMEHPNIASIFDGGTTETGRPFFVMELVQGVPITSYCDANRLSTRERLELFAEVCHAVQHAHQKGVIHRDLKPSNILIAVKDGRAVPKVIDFGIAKATQSSLSGRARVTRLNQWLGTPEYMSPEQAGLGGLDVDTRSDIYSLGVLFYELLAGHPPFDPATLRDVGYDAILRVIREEEPPKPSTRLNDLTKNELGTVAENRGLDPARLHRQLRGDLDWIVMKALEKDRNRRYETANAFAQDIARFLADEPVAAGPPSVVYRMRKFVRRNRRGMLSGTAAAAALLTGLAVAGGIWLDSTFEKNQRVARAVDLIKQAERSLARSAATDFDDDRHFREARELDRRVEESLAGMSHPDDSTRERREQLRRAVAIEERARKLVAAIEEIMMRDKASLQVAESRAQVKSQALAAAFADFGITPLDGQVADTVELLTTGRKTLQDRVLAGLTAWSNALEETNPDQSARLEDVIDRADTDPWRRDLRQAIKAGDAAGLEALAERKEITEQPTMTVLQLSAVLEDKQLAGAVEKLLRRAQREAPESFWTNFILGETLAGAIDREEGDDTRIRAFHTRGANFGSDHPGMIPDKLPVRPEFGESIGFLRAAVAARPDADAAWMALGMTLTVSGHLDDAIVTYQKAVSRFPEAGDLSVLLGQALLFRHRPEDALPHLRRAAERDPANERTQFELGQALLEMGGYEEARAALLKAKLVDEEARGAKETGNTGEMKESRGLTLLEVRITNSEEAAHLWVAMAQNTRGDSAKALASAQLALDVNPDSTVAHYLQGMALMNQGELEAAKTSVQKALKLEPDMAAAHNLLGMVLMYGRDFDEAIASFRRTIELDPKDAAAHCNLGCCLGALGNFKEAHSALETALRLTPEFPSVWTNLGSILEAQDKPERALESYQKAVSLDPRANKALSGVARLLWKTGKHEESIAAHRQLNDAEAYLRLSASLLKEDRIEDAIDVLQRAVAIKPDFAAAHHDLAAVYIRAERHADAINPARTAVQLAPGMASAHNQLGVLLLYQNDYEAAVASSLKAVELAPDAAQFKTTLLSALLSSGRITAAGLVHGDCDSPQCFITAMLARDRQLGEIIAKEGPGAPGIPALLGDQSKDFFRMTFSSIIRRPHTAEDLRAAWDARREKVAKLLASVTVRIIQIRKAGDDDHPEANEEDSRTLAEGILQKLAEGGDFAELAEKHSQGWAEGKPEAVVYDDLTTDLNAAAFSLKDGDFTRKLIEDKHGFYLLKVESRQAGENADFESPKVQEIIEAMLTQQRRNAWEQRYLARVQDPAPDPSTERARLLAGRALREAGASSRAEDLAKPPLAAQTEKLGNEDPETLKAMKDLDELGKVKAQAEQGDASAQNNLGVYYIHGRGVAKDHAKAAEWFRKAADQGHAEAQSNFGSCLKKGEGVARDVSEAAKWIRKAAEQGNAEAQCEMGFCYYYGNGVDKNYATALEWYRKSAAQNFAGAQHNLGICYRDGLAVKQDEVEAVKWFRLAAEQNAPLAQNALAFRYLNGQGVAQDYKVAVRWYRLAAARNCAEAQYGLGCCYVDGLGVEQDPVEAYKWMLLAAAQGFAPAKQDGVMMERDLTPEQVAEARTRASAFKPSDQTVP